jgi:nicotinate-nucleotide adenylyltransferase
MDVGVFGGTFDPIHSGHLVVAGAVRANLNLSEVIFIPAGNPWLKASKSITPADQRLEMVCLAIANNPSFRASGIEVEKSGPSYTVDTITTLQQKMGEKVRLFFLLGSDALAELPQWKEPERLIQICQLVAFSRPGSVRPSLQNLELTIPGVSQRVRFVEVPQVDISATQIRSRVAQRLSIYHLVPEAVEKYIKEHQLYR